MVLLEDYLKNIQEDEIVTEGLGSWFRRVGEWFTDGQPRDYTWRALNDQFFKCRKVCKRVHPSQFKRKTHSEGSPFDEDYKEWEEVEEIENPEAIKCIAKCYMKFAEDALQWMKKNPEKICAQNENQERCMGWIKKRIYRLEQDLKDYKIAIGKTNDGGKIIQIVVK